MKKPNLNFFNGLKEKVKNLFKKKNLEDQFDLEEDYDDEYEDEYLDEEEDEDEDFIPQEMSVQSIKEEEEANMPPPLDIEPEDPVSFEEEKSIIEQTAPAYKEFQVNKKKNLKKEINEKGKAFASFFKSKTKFSFSKKGVDLRKIKDFLQSLNYQKFFEDIYSPNKRAKLHQSFLILLFASGTYMSGKMLAKVFTPAESNTVISKHIPSFGGQSKEIGNQIEAIKVADVFKAIGEKKEEVKPKDDKPKIDTKLICKESNSSSSLPLKLVNTVVLQDSVKSIAAVQIRSGRELINVREGEDIQGMAQIGKIDRMKLVFKNLQSGRCEYIESAEAKDNKRSTSPIKIVRDPVKGKQILSQNTNNDISNSGNSFKIKKKTRDEMLSNISEVLTQAKAVPIKNPDGTLSFQMTEIVPGSIYSKLGMENGDIVTSINGKKFTNYNEIMSLFGQIKEIDHFELSVSRGGMDQNFEYDFE